MLTTLWGDVTEPALTQNTIELYRLLMASESYPLSFDETRDRLGLTNEEMRQAVDLLNEVFDETFSRGEAVA